MTGQSEFDKEVRILEKAYANAQRLKFVRFKMAWALYQTWKYFDREVRRKTDAEEAEKQ